MDSITPLYCSTRQICHHQRTLREKDARWEVHMLTRHFDALSPKSCTKLFIQSHELWSDRNKHSIEISFFTLFTVFKGLEQPGSECSCLGEGNSYKPFKLVYAADSKKQPWETCVNSSLPRVLPYGSAGGTRSCSTAGQKVEGGYPVELHKREKI